MKTALAYTVDEWFAECPECMDIVELGDKVEAEEIASNGHCVCECGVKFNITMGE